MTPDRRPPSEAELRAAFDRSGVAGLGITFEIALADPAMRSSLICMCNSDRKWASKAFGTGSRRLEHLTRD